MIWEGQWGRKKVAVPTPDPVVPLLWQEKQAWQGQNGILSSGKSALRSPKLFTEVDMIPTLDVKTPNFRKLRNCLLSQCKHHCWRAGHRSHCHFKSLWFNARALRRILLVKEAWRAVIHGVTKRHYWATTELNWTYILKLLPIIKILTRKYQYLI